MGEIKKQSISNTVISYIGAGLGFVIIYVQPQIISPADIGLLRLLYSFSWMVAIIMPFGMGSVTMRFFPKIRNDKSTHHGFFALLFIIVSIGAMIIALLLYLNQSFFERYYQRSPDFPTYFNEILVFAYILSLVSVYSIYSSSILKTTFAVFLTDVFTRCGQLFLVIIYHYQYISRHTLVVSYIGVFLIQLILLLVYLSRHNAISFKINFAFFKTLNLKEIILFSLLMMLTAFASLGIKVIDQLMVGHFLNESLVGIYATSAMMCAIMEIPFNSLERIAQPKISYAWSNNNFAEVEKIYELSSRYMFFIGGLLFCILWASIDFIFMFLPAEYHSGKIVFYIISFSSLFNLLTGVNSSVIMFSHKYFAASFFLFILIAVAFITNNFLIVRYGIAGAALSTLIAIGTFNFLKYVYILIRFKMQPFTKHTLSILACTVISITLILCIPSNLHPFVKSIIGGGVTALIFIIMNIRFNSIVEINKVLKRLKLIRQHRV